MAGNKTGTDLSIFTRLNKVRVSHNILNSKTLTSWMKMVCLGDTGLRRKIVSSNAIWVQAYVDKAVNWART